MLREAVVVTLQQQQRRAGSSTCWALQLQFATVFLRPVQLPGRGLGMAAHGHNQRMLRMISNQQTGLCMGQNHHLQCEDEYLLCTSLTQAQRYQIGCHVNFPGTTD
mmetsp:Transcript_85716/g.179092  ORF Transcript_85716/g.179092 Transcript_85716/m.179092 type:complete len:106 (-) Transcript_85716:704-1021(-)